MRRRFNRRVKLALCAATLLAAPTALAQTRVWTLTQEKAPPRASLVYAVPETDDIFGDFRCTPGSGSVTFFLSTTSTRLKPGRRATATVSANAVRATIPGKLLPNEEAGVPSFEGRLDAGHPLLAALASGKTLTAVVGPSKQTAPLAGQSEKFRKFVAACARP
jgi:hypothetical protein